jgi:hypothetical protein
MKKLLIVLIWIVTSAGLSAQNAVRVNVIVPPPYPDYLSYYREPGRMVITIQNLTNVQQEIYLRGSIVGINGTTREIHTKPDYVPPRPLVIPAGVGQTYTVSADEIQELYRPSNLRFFNTDSAQIAGSDRVGEGSYLICVRAYDYNRYTTPLSQERSGCATVFMRNLEAPILIQPLEAAEIQSTGIQNVIFSWTRPAGAPSGITYRLKIVELFDPNRNPNDAYLSATSPAFFDQEVMNNVYVYGPTDPPLVEGRKYAWAITALDPDRRNYSGKSGSIFQNGGRSEVRSFIYKKPFRAVIPAIQMPEIVTNITPAPLQAVLNLPKDTLPDFSGLNNMTVRSASLDPVMCGCSEDVPDVVTPASIDVGEDIKVNSFVMKITAIEKDDNGRFTGTGTIPVPIVSSNTARLRVRFTDMEVSNALGRKTMIAGVVKGLTRSNMSLLPNTDNPDLSAAPLSTDDIHSIDHYLSQQKDQLVSNLRNSAQNAGFELPVGIDKGPVTIGVTQVFFTARQAWFNAVSSMEIPDGNAKAAFEMTGACMTSENLCGEFRLKLKEDLPLPSVFMKLVKGDPEAKGTYVTFNKEGFKELSLAVDYTFPGSIKAVSTDQNLTARLNAKTTKGWTDWVAAVEMPDFYIDGVKSISFSLDGKTIYYDHSDRDNPQGMPASLTVGNETYSAISSKTWQGFYIPEIKVKLPSVFKNVENNSSEVSFSGKQLIIDNNGLTGKIQNTTPLLTINQGSLGGWYASVDHVIFNFFKSGFRESKLTGKFALPGTQHTNMQNQLDYVSLLTTGSGSGIKYNFTVKPKENLKFDALLATINISNNSQITVEAGGNETFIAKTELHGKITIKNPTPIAGMGSIDMPGMAFQNLKFQTMAPFWDKDGFFFEFASPQKKVAGFNFSIDTPLLDVKSAGSQNAEVKLRFAGTLGLIEEGWTCKAETAIAIKAKFAKQNNGRIVVEGLGGELENIDFGAGAKLGPLTVEGYVKYYNKGNDEGFIGALHTQVAEMLGVTMRAQFGSKRENNGSFKYFDFGAMVDFGQTGITFAPPVPLALYGFGGGITYNMKPEVATLPKAERVPTKVNQTSTVEPMPLDNKYKSENTAASEDPLEDLLKHPAGIVNVPAKGHFGLNATILFGLTSRNTLDADATLSMGFTSSGGIHYIRLNGNARILTDISTPLPSRKDVSTGVGSLVIDYNFEEKSFVARVDAGLGVPTYGNAPWIKANGFVEFASDRDGWHLYAGRPPGNGEGPNGVKMLRKDLIGGSNTSYLFEGYSYFEVGSRIDKIPPIPQEVYNYAGSGDRQTGRVQLPATDPNRGNYSPNKGLIVGSHTGFSTGKIRFLMFYGELDVKSGFDISILSDVKCAGFENPGGPGGWYATGQAYFGAKAEIGVTVNLLLIKGDFGIFSGGAGAIISAGLPNPTWVEGIVGGNFSILDGAVKGRFNLKMSIGTKCQQPSDVFGGLDIISEVQPAPQKDPPISILSVPSVTFNLDVGKTFEFDDYGQLTKKGNPTKRYFKFDQSCIEITLKKGNGAVMNIPLESMRTNPHRNHYTMDMNKVFGQSHLSKLTSYTFKVKAYLKEQYKFSGLETDYRYIKNGGGLTDRKANAAFQEDQTEFTTDKGFEKIRPEEYWITAPLHSHKAVPYAEDPAHYIKFKNKLNLADYLADASSATTYQLRVFRNGVRQGADMPIQIDGDIYTSTRENRGREGVRIVKDYHMQFNFDRVNLQPSSDYVFTLIAKNPPKAGDPQLQKMGSAGRLINTSIHALQMEDRAFLLDSVRIFKNVVSGGSNNLGAGEAMIGGFIFRTSKYATYEEKVTKTFELSEIKILQGSKEDEIIKATNTAQKNRQLFEKYIKPDHEGVYTIIYGNTNFSSDGKYRIDENFSIADDLDYYTKITSDQLFNVTTGVNNKTLEIENKVTKTGIFRIGDQIPVFIAGRTGIPESKIKTKMVSEYSKLSSSFRDAGGHCQPAGGMEIYRNSAIDTKVGANIPEGLPQLVAIQGNQNTANNGSGGITANYSLQLFTTGLDFQSTGIVSNYLSTTYGASYLNRTLLGNCRLGREIVISNPIQAAINKVINSRINPNPEMNVSNAATTMLNQVGSWQAINQIGGGLQNGSVNPAQAGIQIGNVLR